MLKYAQNIEIYLFNVLENGNCCTKQLVILGNIDKFE
jgi:hypothetical protein